MTTSLTSSLLVVQTRFMAAVVIAVLAIPGEALARGVPENFADLAARLSPAVVNISTSQTVSRSQGKSPMPQIPGGTPFEEFFKEFFDRQRRGDGSPRKVQSQGSGFVIDPTGTVVTNNHVIEDADEIEVKFADGTVLPAKLLGRDAKTDLAVLKVESTVDLPFVNFADSDKARVGEWVMAIGNPFGLGGSVSVGIISARNRNINTGPYDDFIQTDAAINRGNSGGPLFNMDGDVIGVNSAIISPSGGSVGIGFSIPSALALNITNQLRQYGETRRGWLGVKIQTVTEEIAESLGLDDASGALVAGLSPEGPAAKSGIEQGDIILEFGGKKVDEMHNLPRIVAETEIGRTIDLVIWRNGKRQTVPVTIGRLDETQAAAFATMTGDEPDGSTGAKIDSLGLTLSGLNTEARDQFDIGEDINGVLVEEVAAESSAAEKGIRPGDVIVEVAQEEVANPRDVAELVGEIEKTDRKSVLLLLNRGGDLRFVAVKLQKS